jgi:hypothetical protein
MARPGSKCWPASEKLSGVAFTIPMTIAFDPSPSHCFAMDPSLSRFAGEGLLVMGTIRRSILEPFRSITSTSA